MEMENISFKENTLHSLCDSVIALSVHTNTRHVVNLNRYCMCYMATVTDERDKEFEAKLASAAVIAIYSVFCLKLHLKGL